jgi:hypothetical protein
MLERPEFHGNSLTKKQIAIYNDVFAGQEAKCVIRYKTTHMVSLMVHSFASDGCKPLPTKAQSFLPQIFHNSNTISTTKT